MGLFPDGPNIYNYASQSPLMNTDPTGLETPRYYPLNLAEHMAMAEAMSSPLESGQCIIEKLNDPRFPSGAQKFQFVHRSPRQNITIHYVCIGGMCGDFKFK